MSEVIEFDSLREKIELGILQPSDVKIIYSKNIHRIQSIFPYYNLEEVNFPLYCDPITYLKLGNIMQGFTKLKKATFLIIEESSVSSRENTSAKHGLAKKRKVATLIEASLITIIPNIIHNIGKKCRYINIEFKIITPEESALLTLSEGLLMLKIYSNIHTSSINPISDNTNPLNTTTTIFNSEDMDEEYNEEYNEDMDEEYNEDMDEEYNEEYNEDMDEEYDNDLDESLMSYETGERDDEKNADIVLDPITPSYYLQPLINALEAVNSLRGIILDGSQSVVCNDLEKVIVEADEHTDLNKIANLLEMSEKIIINYKAHNVDDHKKYSEFIYNLNNPKITALYALVPVADLEKHLSKYKALEEVSVLAETSKDNMILEKVIRKYKHVFYEIYYKEDNNEEECCYQELKKIADVYVYKIGKS